MSERSIISAVESAFPPEVLGSRLVRDVVDRVRQEEPSLDAVFRAGRAEAVQQMIACFGQHPMLGNVPSTNKSENSEPLSYALAMDAIKNGDLRLVPPDEILHSGPALPWIQDKIARVGGIDVAMKTRSDIIVWSQLQATAARLTLDQRIDLVARYAKSETNTMRTLNTAALRWRWTLQEAISREIPFCDLVGHGGEGSPHRYAAADSRATNDGIEIDAIEDATSERHDEKLQRRIEEEYQY